MSSNTNHTDNNGTDRPANPANPTNSANISGSGNTNHHTASATTTTNPNPNAKRNIILAVIAAIVVIVLALVTFQFGRRSSSGSSGADAGKSAATAASATGKKTVRVGILQLVTHPALDQIHQGVIDGLKSKGYVEGKNLTVDYENGQGDQSKLATMSQQLVSKKPDVLVGIATASITALANAANGSIPIIMAGIADPIGSGFVTDLAHPDKNITGVYYKVAATDQIKLASKLLPSAKRMGILYTSSEDNVKSQVTDSQKQAEAQGMSVKRFPVPSSNEITQTIQVMSSQVDFIYVPNDNTMANAMTTVVQEANKEHKPIITVVDTMVRQGGLAAIGMNQHNLGLESGKMTATVLGGTTPANLPVRTPKKGDVIINKTEANLLGVKIPADLAKSATFVESKQ